MATSRAQVWANSKQAKKGIASGHPELTVECPQCHSPAGRTWPIHPFYTQPSLSAVLRTVIPENLVVDRLGAGMQYEPDWLAIWAD